jgi:hypothetical protein
MVHNVIRLLQINGRDMKKGESRNYVDLKKSKKGICVKCAA